MAGDLMSDFLMAGDLNSDLDKNIKVTEEIYNAIEEMIDETNVTHNDVIGGLIDTVYLLTRRLANLEKIKKNLYKEILRLREG